MGKKFGPKRMRDCLDVDAMTCHSQATVQVSHFVFLFTASSSCLFLVVSLPSLFLLDFLPPPLSNSPPTRV